MSDTARDIVISGYSHSDDALRFVIDHVLIPEGWLTEEESGNHDVIREKLSVTLSLNIITT